VTLPMAACGTAATYESPRWASGQLGEADSPLAMLFRFLLGRQLSIVGVIHHDET